MTISPTSPKDVFRIKDLHSVVNSNGRIDHNKIEDIMMQFESSGCNAINNIINGHDLTHEYKEQIAYLWALQLLRAPFTRGGVEKTLKSIVEATTRMADQQGKIDKLPDSLKSLGNTFSDLIDNGAVNVEICLPQVTMMSLAAWPNVAKLLNSMNWCILESKNSDFFLLSDNACTIVDPHFERCQMGVGISNKNVEVSLPIGKNHCLIGSWNNIPQRKFASFRLVRIINQRTALFGNRFFVYPRKEEKIKEFLSRYSDVIPKMDTQSFPTPGTEGTGYMIISRQNIFDNPHARKLYKSLPLVFPKAVI